MPAWRRDGSVECDRRAHTRFHVDRLRLSRQSLEYRQSYALRDLLNIGNSELRCRSFDVLQQSTLSLLGDLLLRGVQILGLILVWRGALLQLDQELLVETLLLLLELRLQMLAEPLRLLAEDVV